MPKWFSNGFIILFFMGLILFLGMTGILVKSAASKPIENADYYIVLGAKVKGSIPSTILQLRIDAAFQYLVTNPNTIAIVSGGQGEGEDITEATAMQSGLIDRGIEKNRILLEEQSKNTYENIRNSMVLIPDNNASIVIGTSDFHVFRGCAIARKQGLTRVTGCASKPYYPLLLNNYTRECFAVIKDFLVGNIK